MTKPYLSFDEQPSFKELLELVTSGKAFNLVFGAGVSMGAGLPSWPGLVSALADQISDKDIRAAVKADAVDVIRKADIVNMLLAGAKKGSIRKELYPDSSQPPPGSLATAIARLAVNAPETCHLITTNYDNLVEESIRIESEGRYVGQALTFKNAADWPSIDRSSSTIPIMHVHGFIDRGDTDNEEPIILTESEFRKYGSKIRNFLAQEMRARPTIFLGVSLTDPNVVGPLDELGHNGGHATFVVSGPDAVQGVEPSVMLDYSRVKAVQLETMFSTHVVRTKSYGQVSQVVREMLAVQDPVAGGRLYLNKRSSSRYGRRYQTTLRRAYKNLGCSGTSLRVTPDVLESVRQKLNDQLNKTLRPHLRDAVEPGRDRFRRDFKVDLREVVMSERLNLTLWLRVPAASAKATAEYAIQPVGCSAFSHSDAWAYVREQTIAPFSDYPAVDSVFTESTRLVELRGAVWPSMLAVPLMVQEENGSEICLGSVTLQSADDIDPLSSDVSLLVAAEQDRQIMDRIASCLNQIGLRTAGLAP